MSRILILGKDKQKENAFGSATLMTEALSKLSTSHQFIQTNYAHLAFDLDAQRNADVLDTLNSCSVATYDFVFIRDWFVEERERALALAMWLKAQKIPYLNTEALQNRSASKLTQIMHMVLNNIPTTPTLNGSLQFVLDQIAKKAWRYPLIIKSRGGSRGRANFQVQNSKELIDIFKRCEVEKTAWKLLVQQFIPNDGDYRFICYRGDIKLAMFRQRQDKPSHLNNTSQGGKASLVDPEDIKHYAFFPKLQQDIIAISKRWGREFTGIDVILDEKSYVILEINNMPQLETGAFVEEKLQIFIKAIESELELQANRAKT